MKKGITILIGPLVFFQMGYAQNMKYEKKVDPVLKTLFNAKKQAQVAGKELVIVKSGNSKLAGTQKYECIVYTKNSKALKNKGIVIHSALPTFITCIVTLNQIQQMSEMSEVTYIEASKNNYPTQRDHNTTPSID